MNLMGSERWIVDSVGGEFEIAKNQTVGEMRKEKEREKNLV